ncbi:hypothetical protein B4102_1762 [Heyndrickxia sporothermodurans]|uniref:Uncharacterized protein n=1 Tax=Heyndrickxia sporothermodurans TaxID=46224 RepID=A0A150LHC1_9BACI|nr:hypothetical protein B4102_1762 [Heyndrickxia sporothermodurans]
MTPAGFRGKVETPQAQSAEEVRLPPRGKQVPAAERNGPFILLQQYFRKHPCEKRADKL